MIYQNGDTKFFESIERGDLTAVEKFLEQSEKKFTSKEKLDQAIIKVCKSAKINSNYEDIARML
jgi:hypothetical protein